MPADPRYRSALLLFLGCLVASTVLYAPAVRFPSFAESYVEFDPASVSHFPISRWLRADGTYYRPAARWLYHLWYVACGRESVPWLDHVLQIALHVGSVGLLFLLLLQQTGSALASSAGALTLGLHPSITGAVVYSSVAWSAVVTFLFLAACNLYQWSFNRLPKPPPLSFFVLSAILLLFLALVAETGALAVAIVIVWVAVTVGRRPGRRTAIGHLGSLAAAGVAYLTMRRAALGTFVSPYVAVDLGLVERLQTYAGNLLYDTTLLVNPIRISAFDVDPAREATLVRAALLCVLVVAGAASHRRTRAFLSSRPLPTMGLLMFFLFQSMALWLVRKSPIAQAGVHRGWAYHTVVALMGLLAGHALHAVAAGLRSPSRVVLGLGWGAYLLSAAVATHHSLLLWGEAGDLLRRHRTALTPLLRGLPEGTALAVQGFPDALRVPYLPWAEVYYYSKSKILSTWAGKPLKIYWEIKDAPPPDGFRGYVLENIGGMPRWRREDSRTAVLDYLARQRTMSAARRPLFDGMEPGSPVRGLFPRAAEVRVMDAETLLVRLLDSDPNLSLRVAIDPLAYGVLRYELRILCLDGPSSSATTQVYFRREGQEFDELKSMALEVPADGVWHDVRWALFQNPRWIDNGAIDYLRLDVLDRPGTVELRGVRLENDLPWARETSARLEQATP